MFLTVIRLLSFTATLFANVCILNIYYTSVINRRITQRRYEVFRDSIEGLISRYRKEFSVPVVTNWKDFEFFYKQRMKGIAIELRAMIDGSSSFIIDNFGRPSLLEAREKHPIISLLWRSGIT